MSYNWTISSLQKGTLWQAALQLLGSMRSTDCLPDLTSYNATISSCEKLGQWAGLVLRAVASDFCQFLESHPGPKDAGATRPFGSQPFGYGSKLNLQNTTVVVPWWNPFWGYPIDPPPFGSWLPKGFSLTRKDSQWEVALRLLQKMPTPDILSFNACISSCAKARKGRAPQAERRVTPVFVFVFLKQHKKNGCAFFKGRLGFL